MMGGHYERASMTRTEVHKFGGTSVSDAARMQSVAAIVDRAARQSRVVVVVSAMAGVTDALVRAADVAREGRRDESVAVVSSILARHEAALDTCGVSDAEAVRASVRSLGEEVCDVLRAVARLKQLSGASRDRVLSLGEKLSVRVLASVLRAAGMHALALDADGFLETDASFGEANPVAGAVSRSIAAALTGPLEQGAIVVTTGFLGRAPDGSTTTLGRGGSDFSATLIAAALRADEVVIWTDVDGVYSANPRVVPEARRIRQLNFREAAELSFYGAKVLHQRTIIPVASLGIPVRIKSSFEPDAEGTTVDVRFTPGSHPVKAISAIGKQALVSVEGKGMAGVPGVAARVFGALARLGISVTMISQSSSESSICLAVPEDDAEAAELALKQAFRSQISAGDVDEIVVRRGVGLVAAVGLGMAHTPGVSGRLFAALGKRRINVLAVAQGSSELNISFAVDQAQADDAIRAVHEDFGLHRADTGEDTAGRMDILLLGFGNIGRALSELLIERRAHVFQRFGLEPRIVAVCDRSGYVFRPNAIAAHDLRVLQAEKAGGHHVAAMPGAIASTDPTEMVREALAYRLARPVLVDVSDYADAHLVMLEAMKLGCDIVTANKKPLAGPFAQYRQLRDDAAELGRILKAEATVGAGLPVIDTLETMLGAGDRLTCAQGCLSGTLAFVLSQLENGTRFSDAVLEAVRLGYTEPDPMVDLCGADVGRKAVILGRVSGLVTGDVTLDLQGLVDRSLVGLPTHQWRKAIEAMDDELAARVDEARKDRKALRFVATVQPGRVVVGPQLVDLDSPLGMLRGTDNMIVFWSERYDKRPLVITGPGAGVDVTAMGVMGDILRIAAERR